MQDNYYIDTINGKYIIYEINEEGEVVPQPTSEPPVTTISVTNDNPPNNSQGTPPPPPMNNPYPYNQFPFSPMMPLDYRFNRFNRLAYYPKVSRTLRNTWLQEDNTISILIDASSNFMKQLKELWNTFSMTLIQDVVSSSSENGWEDVSIKMNSNLWNGNSINIKLIFASKKIFQKTVMLPNLPDVQFPEKMVGTSNLSKGLDALINAMESCQLGYIITDGDYNWKSIDEDTIELYKEVSDRIFWVFPDKRSLVKAKKNGVNRLESKIKSQSIIVK